MQMMFKATLESPLSIEFKWTIHQNECASSKTLLFRLYVLGFPQKVCVGNAFRCMLFEKQNRASVQAVMNAECC